MWGRGGEQAWPNDLSGWRENGMLEVFSRVMVALVRDKVADMTLSTEQRSLCRMTRRVG